MEYIFVSGEENDKDKLFSVALFSLLLITVFPVKGISRPAYALTQTDDFIVENDYTLVTEESSTDGTIEVFTQVWVKPSASYPPGPNTPPPTGGFGVSYNANSNKDQYDKDFYDTVRSYISLIDPNIKDITDKVPGAGLALLYAAIPSFYTAIAYFGEKTGVYVIIAEVDLNSLQPKDDGMTTNSAYTEEDMTEITVVVGEKVSKELHLPGFGTIMAVAAIATLAAITYTIQKRKKQA